MAVQRRFFIATTADEWWSVVRNCALVGDFDGGQIWHDYTSAEHDLWYLDENELDEGEKEKLEILMKEL